jgi:hypothetical protein
MAPSVCNRAKAVAAVRRPSETKMRMYNFMRALFSQSSGHP